MRGQGHVVVAGCRHGGLAVTRALGPLGFRITAVTPDPDEFGTASRYVSEVAVCPPPQDEEAFAAFLLRHCHRWRGALVLETEDPYTIALGRWKEELLTAGYRVAAPHWEQSRWFLEKHRTDALADSVGVPRPRLHHPRSSSQLAEAIADLRFPLLVKPVRSSDFVARFGTKLWVVADASELIERFDMATAHGIEVVLQEMIPGTDAATLESVEVYVNGDGSWGGDQCNIKLRQAPPMWGVMRVGRSVPMIEDVRDHTRRLLDAAGYSGYASAEFKRDPRDGQAKLIEVNARLPRNGQLMLASGTNFPLLIYRDLVEGVPSRPQPVRPTWFIDVVADVGTTVVRDRAQLRRPRDLVRPYLARRKAFAVLSRRDPRPFLSMLGSRVRKRLGRTPEQPCRGAGG